MALLVLCGCWCAMARGNESPSRPVRLSALLVQQ